MLQLSNQNKLEPINEIQILVDNATDIIASVLDDEAGQNYFAYWF